jgi:hypothetical protein
MHDDSTVSMPMAPAACLRRRVAGRLGRGGSPVAPVAPQLCTPFFVFLYSCPPLGPAAKARGTARPTRPDDL